MTTKRGRDDVVVLTLVTGNKGKLREIDAILGADSGITLDAVPVDLDELQGTAVEVARAKAITAFQLLRRPVVIEDTSLYFDALGDLPGPYIKWFLKSLGPEGLPKMLVGFEKKTARASCMFTLCTSEKDVYFFEGTVNGIIAPAPKGANGFGWDPIFIPHEPENFDFNGRTFAELAADEKNGVSHRRRAIEALSAFLKSDSGRKALSLE